MKWEEYLNQERQKSIYDRIEIDSALYRAEILAKIVTQRQEKKWTQRDLAEKIGMKQSAIARIESGKANPTLETLSRIFVVLDPEFEGEPSYATNCCSVEFSQTLQNDYHLISQI